MGHNNVQTQSAQCPGFFVILKGIDAEHIYVCARWNLCVLYDESLYRTISTHLETELVHITPHTSFLGHGPGKHARSACIGSIELCYRLLFVLYGYARTPRALSTQFLLHFAKHYLQHFAIRPHWSTNTSRAHSTLFTQPMLHFQITSAFSLLF